MANKGLPKGSIMNLSTKSECTGSHFDLSIVGIRYGYFRCGACSRSLHEGWVLSLSWIFAKSGELDENQTILQHADAMLLGL